MPSPLLSTLTPFVARFDRATVLAPGLFVSLDKRKPRAPGEGPALQVTFVFQKLKRTVSFEGPEQLGASDLRVLQGLMAMATAASLGRVAASSAVLAGGWQELVRACGVRSKAGETIEPRSTSGRRSEQLQKSLQRLASVRVTASDRADGGEPLVSTDPSCDTRDGFRVSFCAELMGALGAGSNGKQYLTVDMVEARELRADAARLLHFRLANVNAGSSREFTQAEMEHMIWGADEADTDAIRKHRRRLLAQAVAAVGALKGWNVQAVQGAKGAWVWRVSRPKVRGAPEKRKT